MMTYAPAPSTQPMTPTRIRWRYAVPIAHYKKGTNRFYAIPVRTILKHCGDFATNYGPRRGQIAI
jgi:hypothetical protein